MSNRSRPSPLALAGLIVVVFGLAYAVALLTPDPAPVHGDPTSAPFWTSVAIPTEGPTVVYEKEAILTSTEAISRSLDLLPDGVTPTDEFAHLTSYGVADAWRGASSLGIDEDAPVWVVGILASGLQVGDVLPHMPAGTATAESIDGIFYFWDANGGYLTGKGALYPQGSGLQYGALRALPTITATVVSATDPPPYPTNAYPSPSVPPTP